jgi:hypothetical protein
MVAGVTAAAGSLVKLTSESAETADEIDKMSAKIGISKQAYQEWNYVMGQNGMDVNALQTGMKTLNTQILKSQSATDKSSTALGKLGVAVTDSTGKLRSQEDILFDTITALAGMDEGAERAKLAQELLGKSGTELAPMLNQGADSIKELTKRSHELGLIMSDEAVDAGVKLGDTMDDVKKSTKALVTRLGSSLMPIVQKLADKLLDYMPKIEDLFDKISEPLGDFLDKALPMLMDLADQLLPPILDLVSALLPPITEIVNALLPVLVDLINTILPPLIEIVQAVLPVLVDLINLVAPILKAVAEILKPLIQLVLDLIKPLLQLIEKILQPLIDLFSGVGDTLENVLGPAIDFVGGLLSGMLGPAFEAIGDIVGGVVSLITGDWSGLCDALEGMWTSLRDFAKNIWQQISDFADAAVEAILGAVETGQAAANKGIAETYARLGTSEAEVKQKQAENHQKWLNKQATDRTQSQLSSQQQMAARYNTTVVIGGTTAASITTTANNVKSKQTGGR